MILTIEPFFIVVGIFFNVAASAVAGGAAVRLARGLLNNILNKPPPLPSP